MHNIQQSQYCVLTVMICDNLGQLGTSNYKTGRFRERATNSALTLCHQLRVNRSLASQQD